MRIGIILYQMTPNVEQAVDLLSRQGVRVDLTHPERQLISLSRVRVENDLYLLKSGSDIALSVAGALHALGAATLNPYPTVAMMRNKIIVTRMLKEAGVPTPDTYVASDPSDFRPLLEFGPLILKPYRGSRGAGIHIVRKPQELDGLKLDGLMLAQRYHPPDGPDCKIYCIGGRLFGIRRIWPIQKYEDKLGQPFDLSAELRDVALRCGAVFGIDLYGLDTVVSDGRPYVVDVQKFGSYMGVPDAPRVLADYIVAAGTRAMRGELQLSESA